MHISNDLTILIITLCLSFNSCLVISIPENDEVVFLNGNVNQYYNSTLYLPSCSSQNPLQAKALPTFTINTLPFEALPSFTFYINTLEANTLQSYYQIEQKWDNNYEMTLHNICFESSSLTPNDTSALAILDPHPKKTPEDQRAIRISFTSQNKQFSFNFISLCSLYKKTYGIIAFIILALVSGMIIFIVVTLQVDFELVGLLHRNTEIHWWFGPASITILSIGVLIVYYSRFAFWLVNILFVITTSISCMHVFKWQMTNLIQLETSSNLVLSIQLFFQKEVCCKITVLTLFTSVFLKLIFVLWVAFQSVFLGNIMIFCFIFCVVSSANVKNFKSIVLLLASFALYEILWNYLSKRYYNCDINLLMSQNLEAPTAIHLKAFGCWNSIFAAEILFPAITLKYCFNYDQLSHKKYFFWGLSLFYISMAISFIIDYTKYILFFSTITLIGGLLSKAAFDRMISQFWNGTMAPFTQDERESFLHKENNAKTAKMLREFNQSQTDTII